MGRTAANAWKDLWNTSGVEQRVKDYKKLIKELEDAIGTMEAAMYCMDAVEEDLQRMSYEGNDSSTGPLIQQFEKKSTDLLGRFKIAYGEMEDMYQELKKKKGQAEIQLNYYKKQEKYENQLNRDLKPYEYNYNG